MSPAGSARTVAAAELASTPCCWSGPGTATRTRSQAWSPFTARSCSCIATGCLARSTTPKTSPRRCSCEHGDTSADSGADRRYAHGCTGSPLTDASPISPVPQLSLHLQWGSGPPPPNALDVEVTALQPFPDSRLGHLSEPGPEAAYDLTESVNLAFLTAVQLLPARQRAVLLLRDVLGFTAAETADVLDATIPGVNSVLHRARTTLETPRNRVRRGRELGGSARA